MRFIHDAPRSWPELARSLSAKDVFDFEAFASRSGWTLTSATEPETVEALYAEWCQHQHSSASPLHPLTEQQH